MHYWLHQESATKRFSKIWKEVNGKKIVYFCYAWMYINNTKRWRSIRIPFLESKSRDS